MGLGWDPEWEAALAELSGPRRDDVVRVARLDRGWVTALPGGQRVALEPGTDVAVGDWLVLDPDHERVTAMLPRRSALARRSPERAARSQVIAANVDTILLVHALTQAPKPRRLERELVLAFESGARPVVVLNKLDLAKDVEQLVAGVQDVAQSVPVLAVSAKTGAGLDGVRALTAGHRTVALLGPSGAGKSTLVNALSGSSTQRTAAVRRFDQKGRHTTSAAQLVLLADGGLLVDTPGLRAVALWSEGGGLARAFGDVSALAEGCWFADCRHQTEPDCAVREAVEDGRLDAKRLASWQHLTAELDRLATERAAQERTARRGRPPRPVTSSPDDVAEED